MTALSRIVLASLVAAGSVASAAALAQTYTPSAPLTRAEVRADLADWIQAGFDPKDKLNYPANALRAGAIVAQRRADHAAPGQVQRP
jgi:hypothetical protein